MKEGDCAWSNLNIMHEMLKLIFKTHEKTFQYQITF
jgi:hypothetical protein